MRGWVVRKPLRLLQPHPHSVQQLNDSVQPVLQIVQIFVGGGGFSDFHVLRYVSEVKVLALLAQEDTLRGFVIHRLQLTHPRRSDQVPGGELNKLVKGFKIRN